MRIYLATISAESHSRAARDVFVDLADLDRVRRHVPAPTPEGADAILFVDLHQHPGDPLLHALARHPLANKFPSKTWVYDERDFPSFTFPGIYVSASASWERALPVVGGPYPRLPNSIDLSRSEPDLLFSFRGARTHPVRDRVLGLNHARALVEETALTGHGAASVDDASTRRYAELLGRSKFVLCPRGHSPTSFRLFETLQASRVPVVISDNWLPPPGIPWPDCTVRIRERHVRQIPQVLECLEPAWPELVARGGAARHAFAEGELWNYYASALEMLRTRQRSTGATWYIATRVARIRYRMLRNALKRWEAGALPPVW